MRVSVIVLVCLLVASCSFGGARFVVAPDENVRSHGSESVASRYIATFSGGKIFNGSEMVAYDRFALSIPRDSTVGKRIALSDGQDRFLKFGVIGGVLSIEDALTEKTFSLSLGEFEKSSSVKVHKLNVGSVVLFEEVSIYIKSDSGSKNR